MQIMERVFLICFDSLKYYQIIQGIVLETLCKLILILWREKSPYLYAKW